ncbi:MAG TPA: hypothetical protein VNA15_01515 [Candidatus Angelobacter sp.]|nr:hypothetical protein [Candidatus Angelobacter sp.]
MYVGLGVHYPKPGIEKAVLEVTQAPSDPAAVVARFPNINATLTVGSNINLASDILVLVLLLGYTRHYGERVSRQQSWEPC